MEESEGVVPCNDTSTQEQTWGAAKYITDLLTHCEGDAEELAEGDEFIIHGRPSDPLRLLWLKVDGRCVSLLVNKMGDVAELSSKVAVLGNDASEEPTPHVDAAPSFGTRSMKCANR